MCARGKEPEKLKKFVAQCRRELDETLPDDRWKDAEGRRALFERMRDCQWRGLLDPLSQFVHLQAAGTWRAREQGRRYDEGQCRGGGD